MANREHRSFCTQWRVGGSGNFLLVPWLAAGIIFLISSAVHKEAKGLQHKRLPGSNLRYRQALIEYQNAKGPYLCRLMNVEPVGLTSQSSSLGTFLAL